VSTDQFPALDLNAFAQSIGRTMTPHARGRRADDRAPAAEAPWVKGDRYLLERAVINLLSNAIEASPPAGRSRFEVSQRDGVAKLNVTDRGPGIAQDRLARIFDAFKSTSARAPTSEWVFPTCNGS